MFNHDADVGVKSVRGRFRSALSGQRDQVAHIDFHRWRTARQVALNASLAHLRVSLAPAPDLPTSPFGTEAAGLIELGEADPVAVDCCAGPWLVLCPCRAPMHGQALAALACTRGVENRRMQRRHIARGSAGIAPASGDIIAELVADIAVDGVAPAVADVCGGGGGGRKSL
jgi:hypothetical protein